MKKVLLSLNQHLNLTRPSIDLLIFINGLKKRHGRRTNLVFDNNDPELVLPKIIWTF
jgi:hypothetical protein